MTLAEASIGENYAIHSIQLEVSTMRRLEALGLTNQTQIKVLNRNRTGSIMFMVRGTRLAVGKKIASCIEIEKTA